MKKYFGLGLMIVLLMCLTVCTVSAEYGWENYDYSIFDNSTYIYDVGGNFSDVDMDYYNGVLADMQEKYGITYVFIIVDDYIMGTGDTGEDSVWDLAAVAQEKAGFSEDFLSVVITTAEVRELSMFTLGKGQQVMNDEYVEGMLDSIYDNNYKVSDWDGALDTFIDLAEKMTVSYNDDTNSVVDRYGNTIYYTGPNNTDYEPAERRIPVLNIIIFGAVVGLIISLIVTFSELGKHKPIKKAINADYYVEDENVKMNLIHDSYVRSHETRTKIQSSSSSGGGGGGGRSGGSTRTGSSGRSGGGGSRR